MKYSVTYYDYDADRVLTKDCIRIQYKNGDKDFSFTPVDDPPKIYKTVVISNPQVSICQDYKGKLFISVEGFQYSSGRGAYWKTITTITEKE